MTTSDRCEEDEEGLMIVEETLRNGFEILRASDSVMLLRGVRLVGTGMSEGGGAVDVDVDVVVREAAVRVVVDVAETVRTEKDEVEVRRVGLPDGTGMEEVLAPTGTALTAAASIASEALAERLLWLW